MIVSTSRKLFSVLNPEGIGVNIRCKYGAFCYGILVFITVCSSHLVYAATELGDNFYDSSGNQWAVTTDATIAPGAPYLEDPKAYIASVKFNKNGAEVYADKEIQGLFLKDVGLSFDQAVVPVPIPLGGDEFISAESYWNVGCGFTPACKLAKIDFDTIERQAIYEDLIYNAVTSADLPFLLGESYVLLKDGTNLFASSLSNELVSAIETVSESSSAITDSHDAFEKAARILSLNPNLSLPDVYGINALADVVSNVADFSTVGLNAYQYTLLREYVANSQIVGDRLEFMNSLVSFLLSNGTLDPAFETAVNNVVSKINSEKVTFKQKLISDLLLITASNIEAKLLSYVTDEKFILSTLKLAEKSFNVSHKISSTVTKIAPEVASAVSVAIDGYQLYSSTTGIWRKVFLAYTLNRQLDLYQGYSTEYSNAYTVDSFECVTYSSLDNHLLRSYADVTLSAKKAYYDGILSSIESDWSGVAVDLADGAIATLSSPQLYALHFSSAAISFGSEAGKGLSSIRSGSDIDAAKQDFSDYVSSALTREQSTNEWAQLLSNYDINNKPSTEQGPGPVNQKPIALISANATPVSVNTTVTLDGSFSSDPDGDTIVSYAWHLVSPSGSSASLTSLAGLNTTFTPDMAGSFTVQLIVSDGAISSIVANKYITVTDNVQTFFDPNRVDVANKSIGANQCGKVIQLTNVTLGSGEYWDNPKLWATTYSPPGVKDHIYFMVGLDSPPSVDSGASTKCNLYNNVSANYFNADLLMDMFLGGTLTDTKRVTSNKSWSNLVTPGTKVYFAVGVANNYDFEIEQMTLQTNILYDKDGDGISDSNDLFPNDPLEAYDSDNDGEGDNADQFDNDPSAWQDSDGDGCPNSITGVSNTGLIVDEFPSIGNLCIDADGDNVDDRINDIFPNDINEWADSDNDGVGDNSDKFPTDPAASVNSDNDGNYPDNWNPGKSQADSTSNPLLTIDMFPNDINEWLDSDLDGVGDNSDCAPNDYTDWIDSDGDQVCDNADAAPNDPNRSTNIDPTIDSITDQIVNGGALVSVPLTIFDQDGDTVVVSLLGSPQFVSVNGQTVNISPANSDAGDHQVIVKIDDGFGGTANQIFYVTVQSGDIIPPVVTPPADLSIPAIDANGVAATDSTIVAFLGGASATDDVDGKITNITNASPAVFPIGSTVVTFTANDNSGNPGTATATVTVFVDAVDSDNDGVYNALDTCPGTPVGEVVDSSGCSPSQLDTDGDGVTDNLDLCSGTPVGTNVDADGCAIVVNPGLVAYYPFNGNANDESGNNHNGVLSGGVILAADRFDTAASAYELDGVDGQIEVSNIFAVGTGDVTISVWIKPLSNSGDQQFLTNGIGAGTNYIGLTYNNGVSSKFRMVTNDGAGSNFYTQNPYAINSWYHLVYTRSGGTGKVYIDGQLETSGTVQAGDIGTDLPWYLGKGHQGGFFNGLLDDIGIYNVALSDAEVLALYQNNPTCPDDDNDSVCNSSDVCIGFDDTIDTDGDGTPNGCDGCPGTIAGETVDINGCSASQLVSDADGDGIPDVYDLFPQDVTPVGLSSLPTDSGIAGIIRGDGGGDDGNLDPQSANPLGDVVYTFQTVFYDDTGISQEQVKLILDGYSYDMTLSQGNNGDGAVYTFTTKLGPAATHSFHFETRDDFGNVVGRLPVSGELSGPTIELLNGNNLVGLAKDVDSASLDATAAFGTTTASRYQSFGLAELDHNGQFVSVDGGGTVMNGEGFVMQRDLGATLPDLSTLPEVIGPSFSLTLQPGWNIISNPYGGNVRLADIQVQKDNDPAINWIGATDNRWLTNAIYTYQGSDWGGTYAFASAGGLNEATLVPWVGYWIYLNMDNAIYKLVIPKPLAVGTLSSPIKYSEDFTTDPGYPTHISSNVASKCSLNWNNGSYQALVGDVVDPWYCVAEGPSPVFTKVGVGDGFLVEFDFNPVKPDWGHYPGIYFVDSSTSFPYSTSSSALSFRIIWDDNNIRKFYLAGNDGTRHICPTIPAVNEWYHVVISKDGATGNFSLLITRQDGSSFVDVSELAIGSGSFDQVFIGEVQGAIKYGTSAEIRIDNLQIQ